MEQVLTDLQALTGLTEADYQVLKDAAPQTQQWVDELNAHFYDTLYGYAPTSHVFQPGERPARETTLTDWYLEVTSGNIDMDFWRRQWIIGLVHIPRRVTDPFMIGMMSRVQQMFLQKCLENFEYEKAKLVYGAFKRVCDTITGLIAEGYFLSYVEATERMTGQSRALTDRLVGLEISRMIEEMRKEIAETS
jgi:hypothetical protein